MEPQASYRLLLVEDSEEQRLIVEQMLLQIDSERYQVDSAATFTEALTFIQRHSYDMLLIDFYLDSPHTALDLMQEVRLLNLPVVVITADEDRTVFLQCFQKGAKEFLNKPVNLVEMQVRLRSVLHARNYERSLLEEIQERRRIEMQLRQQERMNRILVEAFPHLIMRFDQDNTLLDYKNDPDCLLGPPGTKGKLLKELPLPENLRRQISQLTHLVRESNTDEEVSYSTRPI